MNEKNNLTELDYRKLKKDSVLILPFKNTKIDTWIKNDSRTTKEKALIMFFYGRNYKYISGKLNVNTKELRQWILKAYDDESNDLLIKKKRKTPYTIPDNYSPWTSDKIYDFWNKLKAR